MPIIISSGYRRAFRGIGRGSGEAAANRLEDGIDPLAYAACCEVAIVSSRPARLAGSSGMTTFAAPIGGSLALELFTDKDESAPPFTAGSDLAG